MLVIHPDASKTSHGGSQINAIEIASHLAQKYHVRFLSCYDVAQVESRKLVGISRSRFLKLFSIFPFGDKQVTIMRRLSLFLEAISCALSLFYQIHRFKPDYVYPNNGYWGHYLCYLYRKWRKLSIIYTEHSGVLYDQAILKKNLALQPDLLIVLNEESLAFVRHHSPSQNVKLIANGVDTYKFSPQRDKPTEQNAPLKVLTVTRLNQDGQKRIELLIKAVSKLDKRVHLTICGRGRDQDYYQRLCEQLIPERFEIISSDFDNMPLVYRRHDIFSLPSLNEPFGKVYIEAMASGLGVVAPNDASRKTIIGDAGILCDVTNIDEYANAIAQALELDLSEQALQQAKKFSWQSIIEQYDRAIEQMREQQCPSPY
jgi:glycosyltransferase involved in cell wall biosynthesis